MYHKSDALVKIYVRRRGSLNKLFCMYGGEASIGERSPRQAHAASTGYASKAGRWRVQSDLQLHSSAGRAFT